MSHWLVAAGIAGATIGCSANGGAPAELPVTTGDAVVEVEMLGFRSDEGSALVGLYVSSAGFPDDGNKAFKRLEVTISEGRAVATFTGVPATRVAIGVLHDEDGDKKMKTGLFGRPKEGYGVSRDASATFGPPSFGDAALEVADGQKIKTTINLRY